MRWPSHSFGFRGDASDIDDAYTLPGRLSSIVLSDFSYITLRHAPMLLALRPRHIPLVATGHWTRRIRIQIGTTVNRLAIQVRCGCEGGRRKGDPAIKR